MTEAKQITVDVDFELGDVVYLRVCRDPEPGMVTAITIFPGGASYSVTWEGGGCTLHYAMELSREFVQEWERDCPV